jgi:hypothetical protein
MLVAGSFSGLVVAGCSGQHGDGAGGELAPKTEGVAYAPMHRLNRTEYRNTIRDLLGSSLDPAADFPADDVSYGYDNIAAVLTVSPLQVELYEAAAEELAKEALFVPVTATLSHHEAEALTGSVGAASGGAWLLWSNGNVGPTLDLEAGEYKITARVWAAQAGDENAKAAISSGNSTLAEFDVTGDVNAPQLITTTSTLSGGSQQIAVSFLNDLYDPQNNLDRNLFVDWIEVEGPLGSKGVNPIREKIVFCDPLESSCRRDIVSKFGRRAFRRPLDSNELEGLEKLMAIPSSDSNLDEAQKAEASLELGLRALLLSPHFIYRPELDSDPASDEIHPLNGFEMASRLSYFIWSSMPDDALLDAAEKGELDDEEGIRKQVTRMLADPKADALTKNFAGQWLLVRALDDHTPDYNVFPDYDDTLRDAFKKELELFFGEFLSGKVGLNNMLNANFTYANKRLAEHYGLSPMDSEDFQRVDLSDREERMGLLTTGALLTVTSYPTRTSPVKRGVFVLEHLLCDGPPPPPPGVEGLEDVKMPASTLRERLEQHRENPACATCHNIMDPIGFGLENYDGIGAHRTEDVGDYPIDSSGVYSDGTAFVGAAEMTGLVQNDERFSACIVEQLYTFALGRGVVASEKLSAEKIGEELAGKNYSMPELIQLIATSYPFRHRRGGQAAAEDSE